MEGPHGDFGSKLEGVPMGPTTVQVVAAPTPAFGDRPAQVICGNCQQTIMTTTVTQNGACAYLTALVIALLCCPLFWIPLCMDSCRDVHHICPSCGALLGVNKKI